MRRFFNEWAPVLGLMLLAGALRFTMLGGIWPPGLYHDEAYNGLDALRVLGGYHPWYFAANNGREPFFIYLVSFSVGWLGRTVLALRLPAAIIGTLTIPATYWLGRELFNRRIGLLAAAIMTVTFWPIQLSHIGLRAVSLPLFVALFVAMGVRAYRSNRTRDWIIAGALYGVSFYTYLASRFTPAVLVAFAIVLIAAKRSRRLWPNVLFFGAAAMLVVAPLAITAVNQWDVVMGRPGDISILNPIINHGDFVGTAINSTLKALGMFFWQGDSIPRHNLPYRPVFDPILSVAFIVGLICLVVPLLPRRAQGPSKFFSVSSVVNSLPSLFILTWIAVMLLPTILAEDSPHFLRAVGVLPVAMLVPAIGLDWLGRWIGTLSKQRLRLYWSRGSANAPFRVSRSDSGHEPAKASSPVAEALSRSKVLSIGILSAVILIAGMLTLRDYSQYAVDPKTGYDFEVAGTELANTAQDGILRNKQVFIADRFRRDWTSISFLLQGDYQIIPDGGQVTLDSNQPSVLFVWPYEDFSKVFAQAVPSMTIQVSAGPLAQGDLDPQPHVGYLQVQIDPKRATSNMAEAQFENGLRLLGHTIEALDARHWRLRTLWTADVPQLEAETFFVHLLLKSQSVGSADGDSGDGFYPARLWRVGDVVIDQRTIELPAQADRSQLQIEIGLYNRSSVQRIKVLNSVQTVIDQAIVLGAPSAIGP
jgi:4-amino-4-deoxy-L-arabinose transferase-like glycosyltransferase